MREQVRRYAALRPRYRLLAGTLQRVLEAAAARHAPLAIVQSRAKAVSSFAEKTLRKRKPGHGYDPVRQFTDLCGARVITHCRSEVNRIGRFIEDHFDIDRENSVDATGRLRPTEFGYRSVHYIVSFRRGVFPCDEVDLTVDDALYPDAEAPMKAEIQVRTVLEHAWADLSHELTYKSSFRVPGPWLREIARVAALLEDVDGAFERLHEGLRRYASNYGGYLPPDELEREISLLQSVLEHDPENADLAQRLGKLLMARGDWDAAIAVLEPLADSGHPPLLRDLGVAMCRRHRDDRACSEFRRGQELLQRAAEPPSADADALASLAGTWRGADDELARSLYRRAYEADPGNPYPLGNYLEMEIARQGTLAMVPLLAPSLRAAILRCHDQASVGMNMPWAFYDLGKLHLLLGEPYESLDAYARGISVSATGTPIESALQSVALLDRAVGDALPALQWVQRFLLVAAAARERTRHPGDVAPWPPPEALRHMATVGPAPIVGPVVILAGWTDPSLDESMSGYRDLVREVLSGFAGTIIAGGTTAGISGLAGEIGERNPSGIRTIGYLPCDPLPADAVIDPRYTEIRRTGGQAFTPLEPLQSWIDLLASGIDPAQVKVIGINGGRIAGAEYRIALALGAQVAVIEESGRAAARLVSGGEWATASTLLSCPADAMTLRAFLRPTVAPLTAEARECLARAIHEAYRLQRAREASPDLGEWETLPGTLKASNAQQADDMLAKLERVGCQAVAVTGRDIALLTFSGAEVEVMAEMEHGRWTLERLRDGWRWGPKKDIDRKVSPCLVGWGELPEDVREWDREAVRAIPAILARVGLEVRRLV
ncbi:MAG: RyR domain-containing protein [Thermoanaerobaculaceae bacterium]|nr:RyR domain-containing protein [Thermoanaerobaculaceae bacterium]